ncbi:hypothetical protein HYN48_13705 [Flavobacterium magnum]|uniref:Uncharacterized protein n=1 Tax=Flavobacterium magnum TaxID=2162713 RepID=A0A2S0RHA3_9FLAO|nr:hypothetical protein [Flavobacterium magnum]AWA31054.1 hypothetical protein HYN48_13705 [Flavobacterium magnum]
MNIQSRNNENLQRLQKLVDSAKVVDTPPNWEKLTFAVGGLSEVGFSKFYPELLLIVSSQGRGIIDCAKFELIERDNNTDWNWIDSYNLWAMGIGKLSEEKIIVSGLHGGGLPFSNNEGDCIQFMATNWPIIDLIFEPNDKSIFNVEEAGECYRIFNDYELRAYGFSYNGQYFVIATNSEINIYRKNKNGA